MRMVFLTLVFACGGDAVPLGAGPDRVLDPGAPGPYAVGVTTVTLDDPARTAPDGESPRRLRTEVWYPAADAARDLPRDVIDIRSDAPAELVAMLGDLTVPTWEQDAARDAEPRTDDGRFPVLVFSHGNAAVRFQSFALATHLASHGYVVVAPDHQGNTFYEQVGLDSTLDDAQTHAINRFGDIPFLLDQIEAGALGDQIAIDLERIGLSGHSFGGMTTLVVGASGFFHDERVSVLAPISPAVQAMEMVGVSVSSIVVPTFYLGGTDDTSTPYQEDLVYGYESQVRPRGLVALEGAGHLSFVDLCTPDLVAIAEALDFPDDLVIGFTDGCGPDYADPDWVRAESARYVTAWLNTYLRDSAGTGDQYLDGASPGEGVELRLDR